MTEVNTTPEKVNEVVVVHKTHNTRQILINLSFASSVTY